MDDTQVTQKLAYLVSSAKDIQLDEELISQVKKVYLDYLGSAIAGSHTDVSKLVYNTILKMEGESSYNVLGFEKGLSISNAAFINGTSSHSLDIDDGHTGGSIHPATVVLSAAIAAAQKIKPSFEELAKATIVGYEICLRISSAIHPSSRERGFHNTSVAGIFGAVTAVCVLYELSEEEVKNAIGIAASFAGGLFAFLGTGSEVKRIHPGKAARDALLAVELTKTGLSGPKEVFEAENGVFQAFAGREISWERLNKKDIEPYEIMNIYFKPYPCCRHLHSSIDAIYELKRKYSFDVEEIAAIRTGVNDITYLHRHKKFNSLLDAQMSLPYATAASIVYPTLEINHFNSEYVDKSVLSLAQVVEVETDEEANHVYPGERLAKVEISLKDGTVLAETVRNPLGEPNNPLSDEKLAQKVLANCTPVIGEEKTKKLIHQIGEMEKGIEFLYEI
ncbi:MmgE/PrpD family protein [Oceanobacillus jeddahense]|uniref:MmgE/PrpD family protein n=1 Tax=Oceanobacillus jeddahense TaxID=1462527 RepID=A0ABY5JQ61_9BACI|nr:MmgE/PrpD family protein [Oceanobacillus jeddahense]UUI02436.1 MmgE/PrpD family protein [Oceanobacillus jeddahense]